MSIQKLARGSSHFLEPTAATKDRKAREYAGWPVINKLSVSICGYTYNEEVEEGSCE